MSKDKKRTDVGYKKPPKEHQFKKGHSGNKKGRPKASKNVGTLFKESLDEKILINENGKSRKITMRQAIVRRTVVDAAKGNAKARDTVLLHAKESIKDPDHMTTEERLDAIFSQYSEEELRELLAGLRQLKADSRPNKENS